MLSVFYINHILLVIIDSLLNPIHLSLKKALILALHMGCLSCVTMTGITKDPVQECHEPTDHSWQWRTRGEEVRTMTGSEPGLPGRQVGNHENRNEGQIC